MGGRIKLALDKEGYRRKVLPPDLLGAIRAESMGPSRPEETPCPSCPPLETLPKAYFEKPLPPVHALEALDASMEKRERMAWFSLGASKEEK